MTLLRTVTIAAVFLALFAWGLFSSPFANHAESVRSSEREPALRDNFYDVAMRGHFAWIVGYHGTILRSQDQGVTWELRQSGTTEALFRVSAVNANEAWICGGYGTILHTDDGGKSWHKQQTPTEEHLFGLDFINPRQGWAVGSRGAVLHTDDGGVTWTERSIDADIVLNDVRFLDARQGWAVGEFGRIYHTRDGGLSWTKQDSPIEVPFISGASRNLFRLLMSDSRGGWAFGMDGVILTSQDGQKWEVAAQDGASPADLKHNHLFSASSAGLKKFAVGERGTVLVSQFDSRQWDALSAPSLPSNLNGIAFGAEDTGLIVGNRGVILRSDNAGQQWTPVKIALNGPATGVH
ncbi:MAG: YCF48-related protein [Deltaproteobacteria bacterium]|nr:YCF48-related protein [Deltaproteobacteria bacterium]